MTIEWSWQPIGQVRLVAGKLVFPHVPPVPGVYRLTFFDASGKQTGVYVGEANPLPRRFQHYRTPGSPLNPRAGRTNISLNGLMVTTLAVGGLITVEIATTARARGADGITRTLDFSWKAARVLVERAAEVQERAAGRPVFNR